MIFSHELLKIGFTKREAITFEAERNSHYAVIIVFIDLKSGTF